MALAVRIQGILFRGPRLHLHFFRLLVANFAVEVSTAVLTVAVTATDCSAVRALDLGASLAPATGARIC